MAGRKDPGTTGNASGDGDSDFHLELGDVEIYGGGAEQRRTHYSSGFQCKDTQDSCCTSQEGHYCKQGQKVTDTQVPYFHSPVSSKGCPTDTSQAPFLMLVINRLSSVTTVEPVQALHSQGNR